MRRDSTPMIHPHREDSERPTEVRRARDLYIRRLQRRVRDGSYFTSRRVRLAMERLVQSALDGADD